MNNHQTTIHHPTARCKAYTALLPILDEPGIDSDTLAEVRTHLGTCAYCQEQRAAYRQLETAAYQYLSPPASPRYQTETIIRDLLIGEPDTATAGTESAALPRTPGNPRKSTSPRRLVTGLVPLAAVLVIVLITVTLFANHARQGKTGNAPSATQSELLSISMLSANEGWAVGATGPCTTKQFDASTVGLVNCQANDPLLMHYHNGAWTTIQPSSHYTGQLKTVSMLSATDGWAGGNHLFLHYNGHTWQALPIPSSINLDQMQMFSDTDGWAVDTYGGTPAILHYNGQDWTPQPLPAIAALAQQRSIRFNGLDMISPTEGWVVGTLYKPSSSPNSEETDLTAIILHYANGQWSLQSSTDSADLDSVSMVSATEGWAVGTSGTFAPPSDNNPPSAESTHPFLLHYNQGKWTEAADLNNTDASATMVSMDSASDGWATGPGVLETYKTPLATYLLHYSQGKWTDVPALVYQGQHEDLLLISVQMLSAADGWAVGMWQINADHSQSNGENIVLSLKPLIVHFHNGTWSTVPTS